MDIDGQVCFHTRPFAIPVRPLRCTTGPLGPVNGINKDVSGTRLLPTTVSTYPMDWVCFCHLLNTQHCCLCPGGSFNPPSAAHPVQEYHISELAPATHKVYQAGQQHYFSFIKTTLSAVPTTESTLLLFVVFLVKDGFAYTAIKV